MGERAGPGEPIGERAGADEQASGHTGGTAAHARFERLAISGPPGSFSYAAARQLAPAARDIVSCAGFDAALAAVETGRADAAVLPRENTLVGTITPALDAVLDRGMHLVAEAVLRIEHHLVAVPGARLHDLRRVHSHPAALAQCRAFLGAHAWTLCPERDTATSVQIVIAAGDRAAAAVASRDAAERYGGAILASRIADAPDNFTRFALVAAGTAAWPADADTLSLELQPRHEAGALAGVLDLYRDAGLSVLTLDTRPDRRRPWQLRFIVEICGERAGMDWEDLARKTAARVERMRVLGRYRAAPDRRCPADVRRGPAPAAPGD